MVSFSANDTGAVEVDVMVMLLTMFCEGVALRIETAYIVFVQLNSFWEVLRLTDVGGVALRHKAPGKLIVGTSLLEADLIVGV